MSKANEMQVAGDHYQSTFQHWDWILATQLPYLPATVTKYLTRWKKKNKLEDLKKAEHYLDKFIEDENIRREDYIMLTMTFLNTNEVASEESEIIKCLMDYHLGSLSQLSLAKSILNSMVKAHS